MKIALVGATGMIGSKILAEAVGRGHSITAICRHPEKVAKHDRVRAVGVDVADTATLAREFGGQDAIIHAYAPHRDADVDTFLEAARGRGPITMAVFAAYVPADEARHQASIQSRIDAQKAATGSVIAAAQTAGVKRILGVGGAGTLLVDGVPSMDLPTFPRAFEGGAKSTAVVKELLKHTPGLDWTVLCPSTSITPGVRTGKFRLGLDDLLIEADGSSSISVEDYAMAMVDELESPRHTGRRFTVGY